MASAFDDFVTQTNAALDTVKSNLDNIAADEANLNQQIQDLKAQLTAGGVLTQEQFNSLTAIAAKAQSMATNSGTIAANVADLPAPPPPPPATPTA